MALNFPSSPSLNQVYSDPTSGFSYQWDGTVWQSYTPSSTKNIKVIDDIASFFDDVEDTFTITIASAPFTPINPQQLLIVLGGVVQEPGVDYNVNGTNLIFTTPPQSGLSFSGVSFGPSVPQSYIEDGSVTPAKLSTGGPSWNTDGDVYISGIATITNSVGTVQVGVGTTALIVDGDVRITGILTVGSSSITINGITDEISVGSSISIGSGIITADSFVGDGSGLTGAGSTVADDTATNATFYPVLTQTTTGTITASKVSTTKLTFNPSTGTLSATTFSGALSGNSTTATTLQTTRTINGINFNGSADIVVNPTSGAYSNGQGAKTIQSGGSASGGSSGDIYYIY